MSIVSKTSFSPHSELHSFCPEFDFQEAFLVTQLSPSSENLKERLAIVWSNRSLAIKSLFFFKNAAFYPWGFSPVEPQNFKILQESNSSLVVEFLDRHFKSVIGLTFNPAKSALLFENRVKFINLLGRTYLKTFLVPHQLVLKHLLSRL
jgi:hypothetical protein